MQWKKLIITFAITFFAAFVASRITMPAVDGWYQTIRKPWFIVPDQVFGIVWAVLYTCMAIAAYLVWKKPVAEHFKQPALFLYFVQLAFNVLWCYLFFGKGQFGYAFIEILILWFLILYTIFRFAKVSKPAAWLLIPYIIWVSFAALLNYAVYSLNPS